MPPRAVREPAVVEAAGQPPKRIEEFVGRVNTATSGVSVAVMTSPAGWEEPGQTPEFDEYTLVLDGRLDVRHRDGTLTIGPGEAVIAPAGEWVQYATPEGARYVAICLPAFSPASVHRDE